MSYIKETDHSRSMVSMGVVVAMHLALGYALATGLGNQIIQQVAPPIIVDIIEDVKEKEDEPPPPPPEIVEQKVFIPPPVIDIATLAPPPPETAVTITREAPPPTPTVQAPPPPKPVVRSAMGYDPRAARRGDYQPEYPPQARRLGEEGTVLLNVCAGADGRVESASVVRSSGSSNLDDAALKHFERRRPKMKPATEDGVGVRSCVTLPVRFNLKEG